MFSPFRSGTSNYHNVGLETAISQASPHELIALLFSGVMTAIGQARHAIQVGDTSAKGTATGRAIRILEDGLKAALDERGGELASNLKLLYEFMVQRLLSANMTNNDEQYEEVAAMLGQLQEAWTAIGDKAEARAVAA